MSFKYKKPNMQVYFTQLSRVRHQVAEDKCKKQRSNQVEQESLLLLSGEWLGCRAANSKRKRGKYSWEA